MSRIISHNNIQWTGIPIEYLGTKGPFTSGGAGGGFTNTTYPASNSLANSSSDTYSQFNPATSGEGSTRWGFGISGIPDNATINSITCQIKVACSNASGLVTARAQFFCGDTAKGTALDFTNDASISVRSYTNCGSWTKEELDSLELRITSQKSSNRYIKFYGADLTITYSYDEIQYEVTASSQSQEITVSPTSQYVNEGDDITITFNNISDITETFVTDNDINISGNLVNTSGTTYTYTIENINDDHTIIVLNVPSVYVTIINNSSNVSSTSPASGTVIKTGQGTSVGIKIYTNDINKVDIFDNNVKNNSAALMYDIDNGSETFIPSSYSDGTFKSMTSMSNGYNGTSNSSNRANIQADTSTEQEVYYNFNTSSIPQDATILSVSCSVRICVSNTYTSAGVSLYSGATAKSNPNTSWRRVTTSTVYDLTGIQEFIREEISNVRLRIYGRSGNTGRSIYFYGADLNVTYKYFGDVYYWYTSTPATTDKTIILVDQSSEKLYIKQNNVFVEVNKIYKKISGAWIEQTDFENLFETNKIYINK